MNTDIVRTFALAGTALPAARITGAGSLPSFFAVTDLACASIGAAGAALARYAALNGSPLAAVQVDRRLASLWFQWSIQPSGWIMPGAWDNIAGDYPSNDGWIKLHTNAPAHKAAALQLLGAGDDADEVRLKVAQWSGDALEQAVLDAGGCAAVMRSMDAWQAHPQGQAVAAEPLVAWQDHGAIGSADLPQTNIQPLRPLQGIRVLDLTRVLAGPVAGRFLAAYGAEVLRIDPPGWDEPGVIPEVTLGKRCAGLDLHKANDRNTFEQLLAVADVLLHGYRPGALAGLGYDSHRLRELNPQLLDASLCAYGWTGPWRGRRGFDSLVQMSSGIADHGMQASGNSLPTPLPAQALDHGTGYLMAAAVLHALTLRASTGQVVSARLSLARVAQLLLPSCRQDLHSDWQPCMDADVAPLLEPTDWGPARRIRVPLQIDGIDARWDYPATRLRSAEPAWA